jgi:hypothetical protein
MLSPWFWVEKIGRMRLQESPFRRFHAALENTGSAALSVPGFVDGNLFLRQSFLLLRYHMLKLSPR